MSIETRIVTEFSAIDRSDWQRLDHDNNPFLDYGFLHSLEASRSISPNTGWQPYHLCLFEGGELVAFAPSYIKSHSHGEFVFDWAWASAYRRHDLDYYPKLLTAVPYSPVSGRRLLSRCDHGDPNGLRRALVDLACGTCDELGFSSWHCNFVSDEDTTALASAPLLPRKDWQFHWINRQYDCFDEFLAGLRSRKRKNIRKERSAIARAGIRFEWKSGQELDEADFNFIDRCYRNTFHAHGNHPALKPGFFRLLAREMPRQVLVAIASRGDEALAMSYFLTGGGRLYGRYWGCVQDVPGLHFEAAYYQGIEYCIQHRLEVFESGAQGEHKISRGFVPVQTRSYHLVRDEAFRAAIADFLVRESEWLRAYREQLTRHDPYRRDAA